MPLCLEILYPLLNRVGFFEDESQVASIVDQQDVSPSENNSMRMPDMRSEAGLLVGVAVAAAAVVPLPVLAADKYAAGRCLVSMSDSGAEIRPANDANSYIYDYHKKESRYKGFNYDDDDATTVTIVTPPIARRGLSGGYAEF